MDHQTSLNENNKIKAIGAGSTFAAVLFSGDPNTLLTEGPGMFSGICLMVTVACVVMLVRRAE